MDTNVSTTISVTKPENIGNECKQEEKDIESETMKNDSSIKEKPVLKELNGYAHIKQEFVIPRIKVEKKVDGDKDSTINKHEPPSKRQKFSTEKKYKRPKLPKALKGSKLCRAYWSILPSQDLTEVKCTFERCAYSHDVEDFLKNKPQDLGKICYSFEENGFCRYGLTCRYGSSHIENNGSKIVNEKYDKYKEVPSVINNLDRNVQVTLRKKQYDFSKAIGISNSVKICLDKLNASENISAPLKSEIDDKEKVKGTDKSLNTGADATADIENKDEIPTDNLISKESGSISPNEIQKLIIDSDIAKHSPRETKKIDWNNLLYLAPLTTLGNLPFRRVCKRLGADVTCSEMAIATCLLQGSNSEWALVKRHHSETLFGVQLCGSNADAMIRCSQLLEEQVTMDFVDINMGCPIDLIFKQGAGSALMRRMGTLEHMVTGMQKVLSCPVTLKMRSAIRNHTQIAHNIIKKAKLWDVNLFTVHGRTKEQRYLKEANWKYVDECAEVAAPVPLFGNGDVLTYDDYVQRKESTRIAGVMFARGALIKPWLFTEVKEQRNWDISSAERFDILKDFVNYGLEHWGSDTEGVEKTRRFLLEWLSFLYRYIPIGVLDQPQKMNQRPPCYIGRNDLETLMASTNVNDWIKISEMLLGPIPGDFQFLPKHQANSWVA